MLSRGLIRTYQASHVPAVVVSYYRVSLIVIIRRSHYTS